MKITELRDGLRRVDVEAKVLEISETREVRSRYTGETFKVAEATTFSILIVALTVGIFVLFKRYTLPCLYIKPYKPSDALNPGLHVQNGQLRRAPLLGSDQVQHSSQQLGSRIPRKQERQPI